MVDSGERVGGILVVIQEVKHFFGLIYCAPVYIFYVLIHV